MAKTEKQVEDPVTVDTPLEDVDNAKLRTCIKKGCPYGQSDWVITTAQELNLQSTLRKPGRPAILR